MVYGLGLTIKKLLTLKTYYYFNSYFPGKLLALNVFRWKHTQCRQGRSYQDATGEAAPNGNKKNNVSHIYLDFKLFKFLKIENLDFHQKKQFLDTSRIPTESLSRDQREIKMFLKLNILITDGPNPCLLIKSLIFKFMVRFHTN